MKLFAVYVGGKFAQSLIEVHDIMFVTGHALEDTFDQLRAKWWGIPKNLHIDAWTHLTQVENYRVVLSEGILSQPSSTKLYFVQLGGYLSTELNEQHRNIFVIAENVDEAKQKAKSLSPSWLEPHIDKLIDVDTCLDVNQLMNASGMSISLEPTTVSSTLEYICKYVPLGQ